jgi:hypothetical protein
MFLLLLAAATDPMTLVTQASSRLSVVDPAARESEFRIDQDEGPSAPSTKDRALSEDGSRCSLIGGKVCTKKPRTWIRTNLDPR